MTQQHCCERSVRIDILWPLEQASGLTSSVTNPNANIHMLSTSFMARASIGASRLGQAKYEIDTASSLT